jgi:hypothetical protein
MKKFALALIALSAISGAAFAADRPSQNRNYELRDVVPFNGEPADYNTTVVSAYSVLPLTASEARRLERGEQGGSGR